jgi:hypothetical protein
MYISLKRQSALKNAGEPVSHSEQLLQDLIQPVVRSRSDFLMNKRLQDTFREKTPQGN